MIPMPSDEASLPPFLRECPTEVEDLPLQVQLLTHELAAVRLMLARLAAALAAMGSIVTPAPLPDFLAGLTEASDGGRNHHDDDGSERR